MNIEKISTTVILVLGIADSAALAMGGSGSASNTAGKQVGSEPVDCIPMQNFSPDAQPLLGV